MGKIEYIILGINLISFMCILLSQKYMKKYLVKEQIVDDKGFKWDIDSNVTDRQISDETAERLMKENKIEKIEITS